MKYLAILLFLLPAGVRESTITHNVQFAYTKEHRLTALLPVEFAVDQEEGGIPDTFLTCDVAARLLENEPKQYVIVVKCGDRKFRITAIVFTENK